MKKVIAIPTENGKLCGHFGQCETFAIIETENQNIIREEYLIPPAHQPGIYPKFLAEQGVDVIISGGMGHRAIQLFAVHNIEVCMGVNADVPARLVEQYLNGALRTGANICNH